MKFASARELLVVKAMPQCYRSTQEEEGQLKRQIPHRGGRADGRRAKMKG